MLKSDRSAHCFAEFVGQRIGAGEMTESLHDHQHRWRAKAAGEVMGRCWPQVRQSGMALFICLAVLLMLSLVGAASVQTVTLQSRMAGNAHNNLLAFQAAELALREAEALLAGSPPERSSFTAQGDGGFWLSPAFGQAAPWLASDVWANGSTGSRPVTASVQGVAAPPRYLIEWLISVAAPDNPHLLQESVAAPPPRIGIFRITARGFGATSNAQALLQSTFAVRLPPSI